MKIKKVLLKQDINFLEYPLWIADDRVDETEHVIYKSRGIYQVRGTEGLANKFDSIVLYYLLYKLLKETNLEKREIKTTRYRLAKDIFFNTKHIGKSEYKRIEKSLEKWNGISIKFEGIFYEGDGYTFRLFHILDDVIFHEESGQLTIRFNEQYIQYLQHSKFYKYIDFDEYKKLTRSISARLYEILIKNFKDRFSWHIDIINLAEKLTLQKRPNAKRYYPYDILSNLKPAINEINKKTELCVNFEYDKETRICIFKLSNLENKLSTTDNNIYTTSSAVVKALLAYGISSAKAQELVKQYSESKIKHKLELLKQSGQAVRNVTAWLAKALEQDWDIQAYNKQLEQQKLKEEKLRKQKEQQERQRQLEALKNEHAEYKKVQAQVIFNTLPELLQQNLEEQFQVWLKQFGKGPHDEESCRISFMASILLKKEEQDFGSWVKSKEPVLSKQLEKQISLN